MEWLAAGLVAAVLLYRFPKQTLIVAGCVVAAGAIAFGVVLYNDNKRSEAYQTERSAIELRASASGELCTDPNFPIWIGIVNKNDFALDSVSFRLVAKRPGFSNEVHSSRLETDKIMEPDKGYKSCWSLSSAQIDGAVPIKELEWTAEVLYFEKSK